VPRCRYESPAACHTRETCFEDSLHPLGIHLFHCLTTQQVSAAAVGDRQRVHALAIAGSNPPFEVGGPFVVAFAAHRLGLLVERHPAPLPPRLRQPFAIQHRPHGDCRRPRGEVIQRVEKGHCPPLEVFVSAALSLHTSTFITLAPTILFPQLQTFFHFVL
jgi:hypothetical protein